MGVQTLFQRSYNQMLMPAVLAVIIFAVLPLVGMFGLSFTDFNLIKGWGGEVGLHNFFKLADDRRFIASINVMLMLSVGGVIFQVVMGTLIAVGLEKIVPRWKFMRGIFVVPFVVPAIAVALIWLSLFTPTLSPINAFFDIFGITVPAFLTTQYGAIAAIVIADTWASFPFVMLLILAALQGISSDLDEAASIDGATKMQIFWRITLPLLKPALLMVALFRFIETLKHFPLIFVMTNGGPGRSTQATNYYAYIQTFQSSNVSYGAAIAVFLFLFAAIISFYVARANARISGA
ncbi:carbohydrate ABC transporter membrane protein 1 (CUT1 family) [Yoonia maricola]|uniref:Carbohydrate ABC transporter membrane protein 1 (CUT1 family) n=1 Tax=Yoonia maricola TaxID=420999 RepID=A0A2M8W128_9RHOB|nr:sugar ABC transporter permease [Yoonia maricola]PJI84633.1 carbohydrate ABC transporter membrane protein 1 (CUT1 family) [Yoonia maricola]